MALRCNRPRCRRRPQARSPYWDVAARPLTIPRPRVRYLIGKGFRQMGRMAAALPALVLDALRRKRTRQSAPGSRLAVPKATR